MKIKHLLTEARELTPQQQAFMDEFKAGTMQHPFARHLRIWDESIGFEVSPFGDAIDLGAIMSFKQKGAGEASKALKWLTDLADKHQVAIDLAVSPIKNAGAEGKSLNKAQLTAWYKRNGFKKSGGDYMRRDPKKQVTEAKMGFIETVLPIEGPEAEYLKKLANALLKHLENGVELSIYSDYYGPQGVEQYFILYVMGPDNKNLNAAKLKRTWAAVKDALDSLPITPFLRKNPSGTGHIEIEFTKEQRAAFLAKHKK